MPIPGQLLARLLRFQLCKGKTRYSALKAFYNICNFIWVEKSKS